ncbi:hypothetical protein SO802_031486 [Lithocarpus litseifolius]|uniref:RNase H type-1 domain-containing protein n=1 Tax=Lithocarpus litseifolius TaxID=425828 RepID=A0AAW2BR74_9ROSI
MSNLYSSRITVLIFFVSRSLLNFSELVGFVLSATSTHKVAFFSMIAWVCVSVWQRRNRFREQQPSWGEGEMMKRASELRQEYHNMQQKFPRNIVSKEEIQWKPPPENIFKINFDGAIFEDLSLAGLGVVIRDSSGLVIAAHGQKIRLPNSVDMVEAMAYDA